MSQHIFSYISRYVLNAAFRSVSLSTPNYPFLTSVRKPLKGKISEYETSNFRPQTTSVCRSRGPKGPDTNHQASAQWLSGYLHNCLRTRLRACFHYPLRSWPRVHVAGYWTWPSGDLDVVWNWPFFGRSVRLPVPSEGACFLGSCWAHGPLLSGLNSCTLGLCYSSDTSSCVRMRFDAQS